MLTTLGDFSEGPVALLYECKPAARAETGTANAQHPLTVTAQRTGKEDRGMTYRGDKYGYCRKCGKKTQHVRCPQCKGNRPAFTNCSHCGNSDYKCENGVSDRYHR